MRVDWLLKADGTLSRAVSAILTISESGTMDLGERA